MRLYVAFLVFHLSDAMNPVKRTFSFEHWYIVYFHDLQIWERKKFPRGVSVYTNLEATANRLAVSNLGATVSGTGDCEAQVVEVANRIQELAKVVLGCLQHRGSTYALNDANGFTCFAPSYVYVFMYVCI